LAATLQLPENVESLSAEEILRFCLEQFPGKVALACSFQKEETVLLDLLFGLEPKARVFAIDTHYLFPETYELWGEVEKRYSTTIEKFEGAPVEDGLWEQKPDLYLRREGGAAQSGAPRPQLLDHRHPPRPGGNARECSETRLGRGARALEGESPGRLDRRGLLGVHQGAWVALQQAA